MVVIAQVQLSYSSTNVTTGAWTQLQLSGGNGASLSGGYLTGITPTGTVTGGPGSVSLSNPTNSPSSPAYAMPAECIEFDVFDSSGSTMLIGVGPTSGSVTGIALLPPGGPSYPVKQGISKGQLVWLKAADVSATGGQFIGLFKHGRR